VVRWIQRCKRQDPREGIIDIREYTSRTILRVAIDDGKELYSIVVIPQLLSEIRVGLWYTVTFTQDAILHTPHGPCEAWGACVMAYDMRPPRRRSISGPGCGQ